ncbi:MAG: HU family DNA-binding protein [Chloroflexi bacterium]|nr:HU family DNA-binding protein [Chloroflexota bacterium]
MSKGDGTVGKGDITEEVARKAGLRKTEAARAVEAMLETVTEALREGKEVRLTGFGSFKVSQTRPRLGRNPRTGEPIRIPAGRRPAFSAGARLVEAIRGAA